METLKLNQENQGPTKEQMSSWADELDALQRAAPKANGEETIEYVNWIVQDLRAGKWDTAKANYNNQSDKYGKWKDIKAFLLKIGVAQEIDWNKYRNLED